MRFNEEELRRCCGSSEWVRQMMARESFTEEDAEEVWNSLGQGDWLEAFAAHPKIGERSGGKWSSEEQRGMDHASARTAEEMRELNRRYEQKFGYIFIVCATGKSAEEMRELLIKRLQSEPEEEIFIAAREQADITKLRLRKLLAE